MQVMHSARRMTSENIDVLSQRGNRMNEPVMEPPSFMKASEEAFPSKMKLNHRNRLSLPESSKLVSSILAGLLEVDRGSSGPLRPSN